MAWTSLSSPAVFAIITALIEQRSGLVYKRSDSDLLANKLSPRAKDRGFDSLLDYYYFLRHDPAGNAELEQLIESLVIHETYFFREPDQLRLLVDTFLLPMVQGGFRPRVWCAAAASGEEPYTLAMLLAERDLIRSVELIASDLSARVLAQAKEGVYSGRALRAIAGTVATKWLEGTGTRVQISPDLRHTIDWWRSQQ